MKKIISFVLMFIVFTSCQNHQKLNSLNKLTQNGKLQANSESVTYYLWPMVWTSNSKVAGQVDHVIFTKVRASLTGGGYKCYWTVSFIVETFGWYREKSNDFQLILKNSQGGILARFPINIQITCAQTGHPEIMYRQSDFDPDIYDVITNATQLTGSQISTWGHCE